MKITTKDSIDVKTRDVLWTGLSKHNTKYANRNRKDFTVTVSDDGKIIGGAVGESKFGWMIVQYLWVDPNCRGNGIGSKIMAKVEKLGEKRKCLGVGLDTFSFQAPKFYSRLGYRRFNSIKNHPDGFSKYWYAKQLGS